MQYKDGTITTVDTDATITGSGTAFTDNVTAGDLFLVASEPTLYTVASVTDDTHLELSAPYSGTGAGGLSYRITTGFTPNYDFPEISGGDLDWPTFLTQTIRMIDLELKSQDDRIAALE